MKQNMTTAEDLEIINQFSKSELSKNDVVIYKVALCDTQVDRDFEKFTEKALYKLAELYVGKTVIKDHNPSANNMVARVYKTAVEDSENGNKTLMGWIYIPKNAETTLLIDNIDSGIIKEVSISCSLGEQPKCSICGSLYEKCSHNAGQKYNEKICCKLLDIITDVYELSFVAIPSQYCAGIIKSYKFDKRFEKDDYRREKLKVALLEAEMFVLESEEKYVYNK